MTAWAFGRLDALATWLHAHTLEPLGLVLRTDEAARKEAQEVFEFGRLAGRAEGREAVERRFGVKMPEERLAEVRQLRLVDSDR